MSQAKRSMPTVQSHYSSRELRSEGRVNRIATVPTPRSRRYKIDKQILRLVDGRTQTRKHYPKLLLEFAIVFRKPSRTNAEIEFLRGPEAQEEQPAKLLMDLSALPFVLTERCTEATRDYG